MLEMWGWASYADFERAIIGLSFKIEVKGLHDHVDARYKALDKRLAALEAQKSVDSSPAVDAPSG
uniref:Uncharacterized protein n=1 Tax=Aegilops tauschii subsp. strangulata TaxID=200361 RepID=A0A452ZNZ3_AEGTS